MSLERIHPYLLLSLCLTCMWGLSCVDEPNISDSPRIEFLSVDKDTVGQSEVFRIRFYFEDGNGDVSLRESDGNCLMPNIFIIDVRPGQNNFRQEFCMPELTGEDRVIEGEVTIELQSCCVVPDIDPCTAAPIGTLDTLLLEVQMYDAELNESNTIEVSPIIMRCF